MLQKIRSNHLARCFLPLLLALMLLGCGGPAASPGSPSPSPVLTQGDSLKTQTWKVLMTNKQVYDTTFQTLALLDSQGKLPPTVKARAIQLGNAYRTAHNAAVQSLLDNQVISTANVQAAFEIYLDFVTPYTVGVK